MPLWLARILTVVLYVAVMAALAWVLKATLPAVLDPVGETIGWWPVVFLIAMVAAACGLYRLWPRDPEGRMKPLLSRRR